ncbi:hypothetical protein EIP86_005193 [Pleurotus ostreatoroseus]|nr:hypothetical protein EIP86_005193 [Pleurotus ostreatoroseus]
MAEYPYNSPPFVPPSALFTTTDPATSQAYYATAPTTYPDPLQPPQQQPSPIEYHFHYHYPPQQYFFSTMPAAKRVHWEDEVPRTPSPALSATSATSSQGPITPETHTFSLPQVHGQYPQFQYGAYPEHFAAKPYLSPASGTSSPSIAAHPLLAVAAFAHTNSQPYVWNIAAHPNQLQPQTSSLKSQPGYPIPPATLVLPATSPSTARLNITCALLPFEVVVTPSANFGQPFVTVGDVLFELFTQLRRQVSIDEYNRLSQGVPHIKKSIDKAFYKRCELLREGRADEERRGVRRVDLLMGSLMFAGLEMRANGTAVLHVRPLP